MPTTVQALIDRAMSKSMKNNPGVIATETELVDIAVTAQRGLFSLGARVNPTFFGDEEVVAFAGLGWARPVAAESIVHLEVEGGSPKVSVVPHDDRLADRLNPSVYRYGQVFRSVGRDVDPDEYDSLHFFFSKRPEDPTDMESELDALWPTQYDELLALEVGIYLTMKDSTESRAAELNELKALRDQQLVRFVSFLEHETANVTRRHSHHRRINTETMVPIGSLVAGGTNVLGG